MAPWREIFRTALTTNGVLWLNAGDLDGDGTAEGDSEAGLSSGKVATWDDRSANDDDAQ